MSSSTGSTPVTFRSITGSTVRRAADGTSAKRATCTTSFDSSLAHRRARFRRRRSIRARFRIGGNDNFSATIGYENGSLAHLLYTSLGPNTGLGKERIEIYCDGETYVVDDFKRLIKGSDGSVLWQSSEADKGHFEELSRFGDAVASGGPSPIPFDDLVETSAVALQVEDLLFGRPVGDEA